MTHNTTYDQRSELFYFLLIPIVKSKLLEYNVNILEVNYNINMTKDCIDIWFSYVCCPGIKKSMLKYDVEIYKLSGPVRSTVQV